MRLLKQAHEELEPLMLHMVNTTIRTTMYPDVLKTTKVVPIEKCGKEKTTLDGWRPINVVSALSKVIERVLLKQILDHLESNHLIGQQHHGAVRGKSTQTLVSELQDLLVEDAALKMEAVLIALDQSKAYDLVSHTILLDKMRILGLKNQAINIMANFLSERKQYVQLEGKRSSKLLLGPNSVIQGSTLSCVLYLIYILDFPELFHSVKHSPAEYRECSKTNVKTFVDDAYLKVKKTQDKTFVQTVQDTMDIVENYTRANKLSLNSDKSRIMLITQDQNAKDNFVIELQQGT